MWSQFSFSLKYGSISPSRICSQLLSSAFHGLGTNREKSEIPTFLRPHYSLFVTLVHRLLSRFTSAFRCLTTVCCSLLRATSQRPVVSRHGLHRLVPFFITSWGLRPASFFGGGFPVLWECVESNHSSGQILRCWLLLLPVFHSLPAFRLPSHFKFFLAYIQLKWQIVGRFCVHRFCLCFVLLHRLFLLLRFCL